MPNLLTNLVLEELSLVDVPANPHAMAPLFKRHSKKEVDNMTDKTNEAEMVAKADMDELQKSFDNMKKENESLRKSFLDEGYKITAEGVQKAAPVEYLEVEGEKINKADVPAPILKRLEEAEVEKAENAIVKRCAEVLPNVAEKNARVLLKAYDGLSDDEAQEFEEFMRAMDALFDGMTDEVGKSSAKEDLMDPSEKLDALSKAYAEEHKMTKAQAYAAVVKTDEGKALVKETYKAKKD